MSTRVNGKKRSRITSMLVKAALLAALLPASAFAQSGQTYAYPTKGQSPEQQAKDTSECQAWAAQQTGYSPAAADSATSANSRSQQQGQVLRGAGRGAAMGAVGGAIAGDAGTGAAAGAAMGGMAGGMRRRRERRQQQNAQQQQSQAQSSQASAYQRAVAACLQGRGYSVN